MKLFRSNRGQIEKLLMFVAMISIAAIAISFIRNMISRQDPCAKFEDKSTESFSGLCLGKLSMIASECEGKYKECTKNRKAQDNPLKCFVISTAALDDCTDLGSNLNFRAHDMCSTCCTGNNCVDSAISGSGAVLRFEYLYNETTSTGNVSIVRP